MNLYRNLYHLPTPGVDCNIAHIYEHTIIDGFYAHIRDHGRHPSLYGWVSGETYEGHIFFDVGFYSPEAAELFEKYLQETHKFVGTKELERNILEVQAEEK